MDRASPALRAWCFALIIGIGGVVYGLDAGSLSGFLAMPQFVKQFGEYDPKQKEYAIPANIQLVFNFVPLGAAAVACAISAYLGKYYGRRVGISCMGLAGAVGTAIQLSATTLGAIIAGKTVTGFAFGFASAYIPLFLSEIAPTANRGAIVCLYEISAVGSQIIAAGLNWRTHALTNHWAYRIPFLVELIPPIILFFAIWIVPESPRWLIVRGQTDAAKRSLRRLRGAAYSHEAFNEEYDMIVLAVEEEKRLAASQGSVREIFRGGNARRTWTVILVFFFQQYAGVSFLTSYGTLFFKLAGLTNSFMLNTILQIMATAGAIVSAFLAHGAPRRRVFIIGGVLQATCMLMFAIIGVADPGSQAARKCLGAFTLLFSFCNHATWEPIGYAVVSEIPATTVRGPTYAVATSVKWLFQMSMAGWLPYALNKDYGNLGAKMGFIFGPIIAIGTVWLYFYLPETRGRTLEEVDELYSERVPARKSAAYVCHALREKTAAFERAGGASREDTSEEKVQVEEME